MSTYLITGATSGFGLQVALRLARQGGNRLILPVRNLPSGEALRQRLSATGRSQVSTPLLDLASLPNVAAFLTAFEASHPPLLDGVLLNAGVASANRIEFTEDGYETTFAVNHLANYLLARGLLGHLARHAAVGWTASNACDPNETSARLSGFRGAQYTSVARLARGHYAGHVAVAQACRDAYATSKLCDIVSARIFAQRYPQVATFFSFDPGLMAGTGLARKHSRVAQWVWRNVLPRVSPILPGTSTPAKSAALVTKLLTAELRGSYNGAYFRYSGMQAEPASPATDNWVAEDLRIGSEKLLLPFLRSLDEQHRARRSCGLYAQSGRL
jgi:NAD(P)-dependent dehydrogenase (short-subunit alcohol dehydrogenase family)